MVGDHSSHHIAFVNLESPMLGSIDKGVAYTKGAVFLMFCRRGTCACSGLSARMQWLYLTLLMRAQVHDLTLIAASDLMCVFRFGRWDEPLKPMLPMAKDQNCDRKAACID